MQVLLTPLYLYCFAIILIATISIEASIRQKWINTFIGRKILHIIAVSTCAYCIHSSTHLIVLSYAFLAFSLLLFLLIHYKLFATNTGSSYGIALFPLAFFVLLQMPFLHKHTITFAVLTLALADAAAGYVGHYYSKQKILFFKEEKSWLGFSSFFIVTALLYLRYFSFTFPQMTLLVAFVPALAELFSYKGSDNFTVPIITALWLYIIQVTPDNILLQKTIILIVIIVLAIAAWYKKWLTVSGALAALFIGTLVIFFADALHLVPLAIFLTTGSIASTLNEKQLNTTGRNATQVFANGIVAVCCLIIYSITKVELYYIAFFISIAISMSDTISSEIGKYCKQSTYDVISLKKTTIGLSGGISIAGTLAGLIASIMYAYIVYVVFSLTLQNGILIGIIGFIGMLIDSVLGSTLQAKYATINNLITEEKTSHLVKGYAWCTNDVVNNITNIITIIFYCLIVTIC